MPGTFQLWNGKFLLGQNGKMAVHPACCCGGPCECIGTCPDDYEIKLNEPPAGMVYSMRSEIGPRCLSPPVEFSHNLYILNASPQNTFDIWAVLICQVIDNKAAWTLTETGYDMVVRDGVAYDSYVATKTWVDGECEGGLPPEGNIGEWDSIVLTGGGNGEMAPGFPLGVTIGNPLP